MNFKYLAAAAAIMCSSTSAFAVEPYGGVSLSYLYYDEPDFLEESTAFLGARLNLGVDFSPYIGLEAHGGFSPHKKKLEGYDLKFQIGNWAGVYAKIGAPISNQADIYALLGYARTTLKVSGAVSASDSESDPSYGLGLKLRLSDTTALVFDGVMLYHDSAVTIADISAGFRWDFGGQSLPTHSTSASVETAPPPQQENITQNMLPPVTSSQQRTAVSGSTSVTTSPTSLVTTPVTGGRALITVPAGTAIEVVSMMSNAQGSWAFVRFNGREGWITATALNGCAKCGR